jgi:hypothetical protein
MIRGSFISWNSIFRTDSADDTYEYSLLFIIGNIMNKDREV